jgi:hypothetical protein
VNQTVDERNSIDRVVSASRSNEFYKMQSNYDCDCRDALDQARTNLDAVINFVIAQGEDISRQDVATVLIMLRDVIPQRE